MTLLITGFEPFGKQHTNVSFEAIKGIDDTQFNITIIKACIPTVFQTSISVLKSLIIKHQPDVILLIGEAGGSERVLLERIAINIDDARIPDNQGKQPIDQPIILDGKNAYFTKLPIKDLLKVLKEADIKVTISNSAGTYICNHLMYGMLDFLEKEPGYDHVKAGFIHVPLYEAQIAIEPEKPFMPLETTIKALNVIIKHMIETQHKTL